MATVKAVKVAPVIPEAPAAGTAYKFNLNQVTLGKNFYFAGYMDGYYLATTDKLSKAVDVFVEAVEGTEGAYRLYFMNGEVKTYIEVYEREAGAAGKGKGSVKLVTEAPATHYTYDATAKTFVFTAADGVNSYYLGTYSSYNTFSVSNAAYITGNNASKVDVSQFPARVVTIEVVVPTTPDQGGNDNEGGETTVPDQGGNEGGETTVPAGATAASKKIADLITELKWTNTTTKQEFKLDDKVTVKINGGNNTGKAYDGDHIRIYATDTPAGTITITLAEGYELVSVKVSAVTGTYALLCVDGTTTDICNTSVTVSGSSVVLNSVRNGDNGKQVRVTAIEVVYKPVG